MPHLYKSKKLKKDTATGKRVPVADRKGNPVYHPAWRFQYLDYTGRTRTATGYPSKERTNKLALEVEADHRQIREGHKPPPDQADRYATKPIQELIDEYIEWGLSVGGRNGKGWTNYHASPKSFNLRWWKDKLNLEVMGDLEGCLPRVEKVLREFENEGAAPKTLKNRLDAIKSFCEWATVRGYMKENPLRRTASYSSAPRTQRRAMDPGEVKVFLENCDPSRKLYYEVAVYGGLRRSELRALKVKHLNTDIGGLNLSGEWTKNRKDHFQPLPQDLVSRLAEHVQGKGPDDEMLNVPPNVSRPFDADLKKAGISKDGPGGRLVFHSLRNTYVSLLLESGASVKEVQDLARHSTPQLTMGTYARSRWERRSKAVDGLADMVKGDTSSACPVHGIHEDKKPANSDDCMVAVRGFEPRALRI